MKKTLFRILGVAVPILAFCFFKDELIVFAQTFPSLGILWGFQVNFFVLFLVMSFVWLFLLAIIDWIADKLGNQADGEKWQQERQREQLEAEQRLQVEERYWEQLEAEQRRKQKEQKRQKGKKQLIKNLKKNLLLLKKKDFVLIDTCSLMREDENANLFFKNLSSCGVILTIIQDVYGELINHRANKADALKQRGARLALRRIEDMQNKGCCTCTLDDSFPSNKKYYADKVFIEMIQTFCKRGEKVMMITEDRDVRIQIKNTFLISNYTPEQIQKAVVKIDDFFK